MKPLDGVALAEAGASRSNGSAADAVSVDNVVKTFTRFSVGGRRMVRRHSVQALRGVSFRVRAGEMVGLLGPNGAGKTTLLKILATLIYPTSGSVRFFGRDNRSDEIHSRGMLGLVTCDERSFYWRLTGRANLRFFATLYGASAREGDARIVELLEALGLTVAADRRFDTYSAGMKQKLAIARGLLRSPQIVLYDEPTRSLDPLSQHNIREWLQENRIKNPQQSHIFATHNLHEAEQLCDRVVIMAGGQIIADGTVEDIRAFLGNECQSHVITLADAMPVDQAQLAALPDVLRAELVESESGACAIRVTTTTKSAGLSAVLRTLIENEARILDCDAEPVSLEDLFRGVVSRGADAALLGGRAR